MTSGFVTHDSRHSEFFFATDNDKYHYVVETGGLRKLLRHGVRTPSQNQDAMENFFAFCLGRPFTRPKSDVSEFLNDVMAHSLPCPEAAALEKHFVSFAAIDDFLQGKNGTHTNLLKKMDEWGFRVYSSSNAQYFLRLLTVLEFAPATLWEKVDRLKELDILIQPRGPDNFMDLAICLRALNSDLLFSKIVKNPQSFRSQSSLEFLRKVHATKSSRCSEQG